MGRGSHPPHPAPNPHGFLKHHPPHPINTMDRVKPVPNGVDRIGYPRVGCKLPSLVTHFLWGNSMELFFHNIFLLTQLYGIVFSQHIFFEETLGSCILTIHFFWSRRSCILTKFSLGQFCGIVFSWHSFGSLHRDVCPHIPLRKLCGVVFLQYISFEVPLQNCILITFSLRKSCGIVFSNDILLGHFAKMYSHTFLWGNFAESYSHKFSFGTLWGRYILT